MLLQSTLRTVVLFAMVLNAEFSAVMAQPLPPDSQELRQLEAMGYDIQKTPDSGQITVATGGTGKIALSQNTDRTAIMRVFKRKKLNPQEELELLKMANKMNEDLSYQVVLGENHLTFVLYAFGPYEPKTFAKLVRMIERTDSVFTSYPNLLKLLN